MLELGKATFTQSLYTTNNTCRWRERETLKLKYGSMLYMVCRSNFCSPEDLLEILASSIPESQIAGRIPESQKIAGNHSNVPASRRETNNFNYREEH